MYYLLTYTELTVLTVRYWQYNVTELFLLLLLVSSFIIHDRDIFIFRFAQVVAFLALEAIFINNSRQ